jgi:hypothetical protein
MTDLLQTANIEHSLQDPETAHVAIDRNKVFSSRLVDGLKVDLDEHAEGVRLNIELEEGAVLDKPVHLCFGVLPEEGLQEIDMDAEVA